MTSYNVQRPEDVSAELVRLLAQQANLNARLAAIDAEKARLHAELTAKMPIDRRKDRVAAMLDGLTYEAPPDHQRQIAALADERRDIGDAQHELAVRIRDERERAGRAIRKGLEGDYRAILVEFYAALLAAAKAQNRIGELQQSLRIAGVDVGNFGDPGQAFFGAAAYRNNDAWIELRRAADAGLVKKADIPEGYR
ncbi:hypothetical protein [Ensifer soli]|uniref:hypothetical protein n=1 Tax=Ciceribacter sp. sgz301302 TaxID=3342379 RepID=UPI0035BAFFAE